MTITASELFRAHRGDAYSAREIDYLVVGTGGDADLDATAAILAAASASPAVIAGTDDAELKRTNGTISRVIGNDKMVVTIQYGDAGGSSSRSERPIGNLEYEFNYQAPSERVYQSLETISITSQTATWNTTFFGGAIGVLKNADGSYDVEGVETAPGNTTNVWSFVVDAISSTFEATVESLMGCVNESPWRGRPAGSMRFVNCTSNTAQTGKTTIRFGFQYRANVTNIAVGSITVPSKDGHDYLWVYRELKEQTGMGGLKMILPTPQLAVVERVFRRANFAALGF